MLVIVPLMRSLALVRAAFASSLTLSMAVTNESTATFLAAILGPTPSWGVIPMVDEEGGVTKRRLDLVVVRELGQGEPF